MILAVQVALIGALILMACRFPPKGALRVEGKRDVADDGDGNGNEIQAA